MGERSTQKRVARAGKQERIADDLRRRIMDGAFKPGQRLPSNIEIQRRYGVTTVTASRATRRLIEAGFVVSRERLGVFVADRLPHLSRFGIAFFGAPDAGQDRNRLVEIIHREAQRPARDADGAFEIYTGLGAGERADGYRRLLRDVREHRIGGLFFAGNPWPLDGTALLSDPGVPLMAIMEPGGRAGVHALAFEPPFARAVERLAAQDRRRIAALLSSTTVESGRQLDLFAQALRGAGLELRPHWVQYGDIAHPAMAEPLVRLLLGGPRRDRPDGLLVADDNLLPHAEAGILGTGLAVPRDLAVVGHSNFPPSIAHRLPIELIGFDIRGMLDSVAGTLKGLAAGRIVRGATVLPCLFEHELPVGSHAAASGARETGLKASRTGRRR
jgi:DNA-binding LacI/PurR family transcriptional regulator